MLSRPGHRVKENVLKVCRERHRNRLASNARGMAIGNGTLALSHYITLKVQHPLPGKDHKGRTSQGIAVPSDVPAGKQALKALHTYAWPTNVI